jgi:hypothetical protein
MVLTPRPDAAAAGQSSSGFNDEESERMDDSDSSSPMAAEQEEQEEQGLKRKQLEEEQEQEEELEQDLREGKTWRMGPADVAAAPSNPGRPHLEVGAAGWATDVPSGSEARAAYFAEKAAALTGTATIAVETPGAAAALRVETVMRVTAAGETTLSVQVRSAPVAAATAAAAAVLDEQKMKELEVYTRGLPEERGGVPGPWSTSEDTSLLQTVKQLGVSTPANIDVIRILQFTPGSSVYDVFVPRRRYRSRPCPVGRSAHPISKGHTAKRRLRTARWI